MKKPGLILVRVPPAHATRLASNPRIADRFQVVLMAYENKSRPDPSIPVVPFGGHRTEEEYQRIARETAEKYDGSHGVVLTPLMGLSNLVRAGLSEGGVKELLWSEVFLSGKLILDRVGCQYTHDNEIIRYADHFPILTPEIPLDTRFRQPHFRPPGTVRDRNSNGHEKVVVMFGQVPGDHATKDTHGGMSYYEWIDALVTRNPDTLFLFKQHPASKMTAGAFTRGIEKYRNVREIDECLNTLFMAFDAFAAYSSTVIFEGAIQRKVFATGGFHFLHHPELCLRITAPNEADNLYDRMLEFRRNEEIATRYLGFITRAYCLAQTSPLMCDRLTEPSKRYFETAARTLTAEEAV